MLKARAAVQSLEPYRPPLDDRDGLRFDFNENTAGCSPRALEALQNLTAQEVATYPDRTKGEMFAAKHLALDPRQVLLTNGVDEAIHLVAETYLEPGDEVIIPVPTFAMYEIYARAAGAKVRRILAQKDFQFPLEQVLAAISPKAKLIVIANPNNPTGSIVSNAALAHLAKAAPGAGLLIDEAYFEFYGSTILSELKRLPNLFVARTFSKAYGMAGLRVGVIAAHVNQIEMLRRVTSPYNVNAAALACLPAALDDQTYVRSYVGEVVRGRAQLEGLLRELEIQYWPSQANFILARFGAMRIEFVKQMRQRGILVRDRDSDPGCAGCVRITLGTTSQNAQLLGTLRDVVDLVSRLEAIA